MRSKRKAAKAENEAASRKANGNRRAGKQRLRPGQLDGLVLGYLKSHKGDLPVSPTTVAHGIKRSSGAVGNCLDRLERAEKVRLVEEKPRRYDLAGKNSR
ncbi:MAG: hypothetical protein ACTHN3_04295 [Solirubrobacterales bacterium]